MFFWLRHRTVQVLWEIFCDIDTSLNGKLDKTEMTKLFRELEPDALQDDIAGKIAQIAGSDRDIVFVRRLESTCDRVALGLFRFLLIVAYEKRFGLLRLHVCMVS